MGRRIDASRCMTAAASSRGRHDATPPEEQPVRACFLVSVTEGPKTGHVDAWLCDGFQKSQGLQPVKALAK